MEAVRRAYLTALGAALVSAAIGSSGCGPSVGSGGGSALGTSAPAGTASISGRLVATPGVTLEGTPIVAEQLVGGRTATVRAISAADQPAGRSALVARVQAGGRLLEPGIYTTTAMADGSFVFRDLPVTEYCLTARHEELIGILSGLRAGGPHTSSGSVIRLAAAGTINGKVRYAHPNEMNPDNSGILAFVKGTSLVAYTQGTSGDYSIPNVPMQSETDAFYTVTAMATGLADADATLRERLVGAAANAPLIFLQEGVTLNGRIYDPKISDPNKQALSGATVVASTGQSATTDANGFFQLQGLAAGATFLTISKSSYVILRKQFGPLVEGTSPFFNITLQHT
jgi:hypothetical protein